MYLAIPIFIILLAVSYVAGSTSKNDEIEELKDRVADLEEKLEEKLGEDWEEDMEQEKEDEFV